MADKSLAKLTLNIEPDALREIIAKGQLLKFADAVAAQAASQVHAQIVWHVAEAQERADIAKQGVVAQVEFQQVFVDGEPGFGTGRWPPRPHWGGSVIAQE